MPEMVYDSGNFGVERERSGYLPSCLCTLALQHHVTPVALIFIVIYKGSGLGVSMVYIFLMLLAWTCQDEVLRLLKHV